MNFPLLFVVVVTFFWRISCKPCNIKKLKTAITHDDTGKVKNFLKGEHRQRVLHETLIEVEASDYVYSPPNVHMEQREDSGVRPPRHGALHWAVIRRAPNVARLLLENGANVNMLNSDGLQPIFLAATYYLYFYKLYKNRRLHEKVVDALLEFNPDIHLRDLSGLTLLACATKCCNLSLVRKLEERGADINDGDELGRTPIHIAVGDGRVEMTEFLLKKGAKEDASMKCCENALHIIFNTRQFFNGKNQAAIAKLLFRSKNVENMLQQEITYSHKTPVHVFFEQDSNREILVDLLKILPGLDEEHAASALRTFSPFLEQQSHNWPLDNFSEYVKTAFNSYLEILSKDKSKTPALLKSCMGVTFGESISPKTDIKYFMEKGFYSLYVILQTHFRVHRGRNKEEAAKEVEKFDEHLHKLSVPFQNVLWNAVVKGTTLEIFPSEVLTIIFQHSTYVPYVQRFSKIISLVQFTRSWSVKEMMEAAPKFVHYIEQWDILLF